MLTDSTSDFVAQANACKPDIEIGLRMKFDPKNFQTLPKLILYILIAKLNLSGYKTISELLINSYYDKDTYNLC